MLKEAARRVAIGRYNEADAVFDREEFRAQWRLPFLIVLGFIRRSSLREFHMLEGDHVLGMVVSEIWLYNVTRAVMREDHPELSEAEREAQYGKCNTYSISQYLGISNATCRRKVEKLIDMGWVKRDGKRQLYVTKACEDAFNISANEETMADFISTARTLFRAMGLDLQPQAPQPKPKQR